MTPEQFCNLKKGDTVIIKSMSDISKTLEREPCLGLFFNSEMYRHCGKSYKVVSVTRNPTKVRIYLNNTDGFVWVPDWLEVEEKKCIFDEDLFEV